MCGHLNEGLLLIQHPCSDLTVQHLPSPSHLPSSLSRTALPSHTSATKFLTDRLYSKKRVIAVLDSSKRPVDDSGRKRRKKVGGGMSEESKALLGMGMDDGSKEKLNAETAQEREKGRKKSLLLQAQGTRKSGEFLAVLDEWGRS